MPQASRHHRDARERGGRCGRTRGARLGFGAKSSRQQVGKFLSALLAFDISFKRYLCSVWYRHDASEEVRVRRGEGGRQFRSTSTCTMNERHRDELHARALEAYHDSESHLKTRLRTYHIKSFPLSVSRRLYIRSANTTTTAMRAPREYHQWLT
jgi:hypothetical protein